MCPSPPCVFVLHVVVVWFLRLFWSFSEIFRVFKFLGTATSEVAVEVTVPIRVIPALFENRGSRMLSKLAIIAQFPYVCWNRSENHIDGTTATFSGD